MAVGAVQHQRNRPVVLQGNLHILLENPGGHGQTGSLEQSDGVLVEALGLFRRGGLGEVRAPAPASAGIQGKLAYNKKLRPYIQGGAVKSVLFVGEDSQVNRLVNQVLGIGLRILCGDPKNTTSPGPMRPTSRSDTATEA